MNLIMCPKSKSGKAQKYWPFWKEYLDKRGVSYSCIETQYPGHAHEIARKAEGTVVAVGGDGTINEVINGILAAKKPQTMGVLYCGTSPDFCRFHRIPTDHSESIQALLSGSKNRVDVVNVQYDSVERLPVNKYFACSSNIGLGADVARFANAKRKIFGDTLGTFLGLMRSIVLHKPHDLKICIDGQEHFLNKCHHLIVIKNPYIASGMKLGLELKGNDGKGYIMAICNKSKIGILKLLPGIYSGDIIGADGIFLKSFNQVEITSNDNVEIEFDGDPQGQLPLKAEVIMRHLELIGAANA